MKMRLKLTLMLIVAILAATLPLVVFILHQQESEKFAALMMNGQSYSRMLAKSMKTIIFMNGGDISSSRVDGLEMVNVVSPLRNMGLLYADTFLISSNPELNGVIIAQYPQAQGARSFEPSDERLTPEKVRELAAVNGMRQIMVPGHGLCYEFIAPGSKTASGADCMGRLIFSRTIILAPMMRVRIAAVAAVIIVIAVVGIIGILISRAITVPLQRLTYAARGVRDGDYSAVPAIRSGDEIGQLSDAFSHMAGVINMKIAELTAANRRLARLDVLKDDFLTRVTHDLRTPLFGIIGIADSLAQGAAGPLGNEATHDLGIIRTESRRLAKLVDDILDFSRLRNSDITLRFVPVDLHRVSALCLSMIEPLAQRKGLSIENRIPPDIPPVRGDGDRLQQVIMNLLDNAVKFTDSGTVYIGASQSAGVIEIVIEDSGSCMSRDRLDEINNPTASARMEGEPDFDGTGLGLAIVKNLIELHNGALSASCPATGGTRMTFTLPVWQGARDENADNRMDIPSPLPLPPTARRSIGDEDSDELMERRYVLAVGDDPVVQQLVINRFTIEGMRVETVPDGETAIEKVASDPRPDLVIIDAMLPRVSGYDLCRVLRQNNPQHELPVLMITARGDAGEIEMVHDSGANDYVSKPINVDELAARGKNSIALKDSFGLHARYSRLKHELEIANEVQKALLPQIMPVLEGASLSVRSRPATEIGGDFYFFHALDNRRLGIILADVSGHGIPAALFGAKLDTIFSYFKDHAKDPALMLEKINDAISVYSHGQFVTAAYLYIDMNTKTVTYSNAGHIPILFQSGRDGAIAETHVPGRPLGLFPDTRFNSLKLELAGGERIIMHTDGISEARNPSNESFEANLRAFASGNRALSPGEFTAAVFDNIHIWIERGPDEGLDDDATMIVIDFARIS